MRPHVQKTLAVANEKFENAVQQYLKDLENYCQSLSNSTWDGEDLMQETLTKAYKSWIGTPKSVSKAYLFRIASNTWIDEFRKCKPDVVFNSDMSERMAKKEMNSDVMYSAIEMLLRELTPKQRVAMLLSGMDYTAQEIAEMTGTSEGAVKAALHRARKRLNRMKNEDDLNMDHHRVITYVTAIQNGKPEKLIDLFQKEMLEPHQMSVTSVQIVSRPRVAIQQISRVGVSYLLVAIQVNNGNLLFIPFYRSEWLNSSLWLTQESSFVS
ncbi:RNA polymerase sigma factor [Virgibacillus necropolis]|uniref:RNA polymerase sigma factor n=1 Tax=Virgibacillus necropolis TaxID=163877 RepID=UPI00384EE797